MKYFDHDVNAHKDDKIILLRQLCGGAAVDAYWTLLEIIYRNEKPIKTNQKPLGLASVSFFLQVEETTLQEWIDTMCELGLFSKEEDSEGSITLRSPRAEANIESYKERSEASRTNGRKGGRPKKTPVQDSNKTQQKPKENLGVSETKPKENLEKPSWGDKEKEKEKKKEKEKENIYPLTPSTSSDPFANIDEINDDGFASFAKSVLDVFNEETGSVVLYFDGDTWMGLRRIFNAGRTLEDVRLVTQHKRDEWSQQAKMRRYIRPSTLYGGKFEEYLAVAKASEKEAGEYDEYE